MVKKGKGRFYIMEFMDTMKGRDNLLIIDLLNLSFRFKYANKKNFAAELISTIQSFARSYKASQVIIACDWGSAWRKEIYPDYKANRVALREKQTEAEADEFKEFLDEVGVATELMQDMYTVFKFKGVEADDIAAYIIKHYKDRYAHSWLISTDKDWDLLIADNVSRFAYTSRKEITLNTWDQFYDYAPEQHISIKVIMGDKGDNVPGVDGIGEKRANTILRDYETAYDVYASLPIESKYKYIQNLNGFGEQLLLNYELMDLLTYCEDAIGKDNIIEIDEVLNDS